MDTTLQFDEYKVTNGHLRVKDPVEKTFGAAMALGCVGSLSIETEVRTITKVCEGVVVKEITVPIKENGTLSAHIAIAVKRALMSLKNDGLVDGVFGYGEKSKSIEGVLTFDVIDLESTDKKLLAFSLISSTSGFVFGLENGGEEIAQTELAFSCLKDSNGYFHYEAFESDVTDTGVKTKWHTEFTPELVKEVQV